MVKILLILLMIAITIVIIRGTISNYRFYKNYNKNFESIDNSDEPENECNLYTIKITPTITTSYSIKVNDECQFATYRSIISSPQPSPEHQALGDNMNHFTFRGTGIYAKNHHKHNLFQDAVTKKDAIEKLVSNGYIRETIEIEAVPFKRPGPGQIEYLENHDDYIPEFACYLDLSTLMSRYRTDDIGANHELIKFATKNNILFSNYIGSMDLHKLIWENFDKKKQIAFFICCVSYYETNNWQFERFNEFLSIADKLSQDEKFMKSFHDRTEFFKGFESPHTVGNGRITCHKIAKTYIHK